MRKLPLLALLLYIFYYTAQAKPRENQIFGHFLEIMKVVPIMIFIRFILGKSNASQVLI